MTRRGHGFRLMDTGSMRARQVAIFHRWSGNDLYIVVLNFSDTLQSVNVPLFENGTWVDLLNNNVQYNSSNYSLYNFVVQSNWGCILHGKT